MARVVPNWLYDEQARIHGAQPNQHRFGSAVGTSKNPFYWEPDLAQDPQCHDYADQYARDVREWVAATEADERRQG